MDSVALVNQWCEENGYVLAEFDGGCAWWGISRRGDPDGGRNWVLCGIDRARVTLGVTGRWIDLVDPGSLEDFREDLERCFGGLESWGICGGS